MTDRIVVVGGVACGPKAAARARRRNSDVEIVLVEQGAYLSYAGCGLPYYVGGAVSELQQLWTTQFNLPRDVAYFKSIKDIEVRLCTEVAQIDRDGKRVHLRNAETGDLTELEYGQLVLATGATPIRPSIEGLDQDWVVPLHEPGEALRIRERIESDEVERAVIIGGGSIGLEAVESLFAHGIEVAIVEREDQLLPRLLDPDMAAYVAGNLGQSEIPVYTSEQVIRVEDSGKVVTDKRELDADLVLVAVGVTPNVELARHAGLTIGATGAIAVDEYLRTSDPHIYAGGDCVECVHRVSGERVYAPLGTTANKHGRVIGNNLTGLPEVFPGIVGTAILKSMGLNIARTGLTFGEARRLDFDPIDVLTPSSGHAHYYPGSKPFFVKLVVDRNTEKLLGAQVVGPGDVAKRIDVLATALTCGYALKDIADLDLAYAPPFSTAVDPIAHASNQARNLIAGMAVAVSADDVAQMLASEKDFVLLDVRQPHEVERNAVDDRRVLRVPLPELRQHQFDLSVDAEIIVLCQSGLRGYETCITLRSKGFTNGKFLQGGAKAWDILGR